MDSQTLRRLKFVTFLSLPPAFLSLFGSMLTLLTIYRRRRKQKLTTYHHLMVGISVFDSIMSTAVAFGPWPMPSEVDLPWAHGTTATCSAQSFFMQLGAGSFVYSAMLMIYFVLVIHFNVSEKTISARIEPFMHAVPIAFHLTTAFVGLSLQVYNPGGLYCWVGGWPTGCEDDPETECVRGESRQIHFFGTWLVVTPFFISNCVIIMCLFVVACSVIHRFRSSRRFVFEGSQSATRLGEQEMHDVVVQCLSYAFVFLNVMVWSTVQTIFFWADLPYDGIGKHLWMTTLTVTFLPCQGLFNFLIFIRPQYLYMRRRYELARWAALCAAVWGRRDGTSNNAHSSPSAQRLERPAALSSKTCSHNSALSLQASSSVTSIPLGISPADNGEHV